MRDDGQCDGRVGILWVGERANVMVGKLHITFQPELV